MDHTVKTNLPPDLSAWLDRVERCCKEIIPYLSISEGEKHIGEWERQFLLFSIQNLPLAVPVIRELVEALQFYAADMNWQNDAVDIGVGMQPIPGTAEIDHDGGRVAQVALANALQEARDER